MYDAINIRTSVPVCTAMYYAAVTTLRGGTTTTTICCGNTTLNLRLNRRQQFTRRLPKTEILSYNYNTYSRILCATFTDSPGVIVYGDSVLLLVARRLTIHGACMHAQRTRATIYLPCLQSYIFNFRTRKTIIYIILL